VKSKLTKKIEKALIAYKNTSNYKFVFIQTEVPGVDFKTQIDVVRFKDNFMESNSMKVTCYEIKISVKDFKSNHGHNFVGNYNFYVTTREVYKKVHLLIPENIGVIIFNDKNDKYPLQRIRDCRINKIDDATGKQLLFNAIRRYIRDEKEQKNTMTSVDDYRKERYVQLTLC